MAIFIDKEEYISLGDSIYQNKKTGKKYRAKIVLIDHGYSFPNDAKPNDDRSVILSRFSFLAWGKKLSTETMEILKTLKYSSFRQRLLKVLDKKSIDLFDQRIDDMLRGEAKVKNYRIIKKRKNGIEDKVGGSEL
jgi:hypothetical protein